MDDQLFLSGGKRILDSEQPILSSNYKSNSSDQNIPKTNLKICESPFTKYLKETQSSPIQNYFNEYDNQRPFLRYNVPIRPVSFKSPSPHQSKLLNDPLDYLTSPQNNLRAISKKLVFNAQDLFEQQSPQFKNIDENNIDIFQKEKKLSKENPSQTIKKKIFQQSPMLTNTIFEFPTERRQKGALNYNSDEDNQPQPIQKFSHMRDEHNYQEEDEEMLKCNEGDLNNIKTFPENFYEEQKKIHQGFLQNSIQKEQPKHEMKKRQHNIPIVIKNPHVRQASSNNTQQQHDQNSSKKVFCNCKKSKCLKLYCDCFAIGNICGKDCNCTECSNMMQSEERQNAIDQQMQKNPVAFRPKVVAEINEGNGKHIKGCKCSKSGCLKKYCECYQAGIECTDECKCENCKNNKKVESPRRKKEMKMDMKISEMTEWQGSKHIHHSQVAHGRK